MSRLDSAQMGSVQREGNLSSLIIAFTTDLEGIGPKNPFFFKLGSRKGPGFLLNADPADVTFVLVFSRNFEIFGELSGADTRVPR